MNIRDKLLNNLKTETYCRIGISTIPGAGVGVIAIKDIPEGTNPFVRSDQDVFKEEIVYLSKKDVSRLHPRVRKMITDFFIPIKNAEGEISYPVASRGLNGMDIGFYLNHSDEPNLDLVITDNTPYCEFISNRKIKSGEELFINYIQQ